MVKKHPNFFAKHLRFDPHFPNLSPLATPHPDIPLTNPASLAAAAIMRAFLSFSPLLGLCSVDVRCHIFFFSLNTSYLSFATFHSAVILHIRLGGEE